MSQSSVLNFVQTCVNRIIFDIFEQDYQLYSAAEYGSPISQESRQAQNMNRTRKVSRVFLY